MNRGSHPLVRVAVLAALLLGVALAQVDDAYMERYEIAIDNLQRSVAALPSDAVQARVDLDAAFSVLRTMSRDTAAGPFASALERVVERARVAIGIASQDDLAVQVAVLEGGFQRLVYDSALRAASDGDVALARARLVRLSTDLGMSQADRDAIADTSGSLAALRFDFEAGVADVVGTRLAVAEELLSSSTGGAYRALARAYGAFLLVQDSPRADASLNQRFVDAAQGLVDEELEAGAAALRDARSQIGGLESAARARQGATAATTPAPAPSDLPSAPPSETADITVPADATDTVEPSTAPVVSDTDGETDTPAAEPLEALDDPALLSADALAELRAQIAAEVEEELRAERLTALEDELAALGVSMLVRGERAEALLDAGFDTLAQAYDAVAARLIESSAAIQRGDASAASSAMRAAAQGYQTHLGPLVRLRSISADADTGLTLELLADEPGLRASDVTVAAAQLEAAWSALYGVETEPALLTGARQTLGLWHGLPRTIVLLVVGLLALVPLVLANIAFGGGNRNWQLVGVAMFLLLLPVLFEGLVGLAVLLAEVAGVELLLPLAALSPFTSLVGQVVWLAVTLLAVVLSIRGLYGICAQFGLVGRKGGGAPGQRATTSTRATRTSTTKTESIDWDDD